VSRVNNRPGDRSNGRTTGQKERQWEQICRLGNASVGCICAGMTKSNLPACVPAWVSQWDLLLKGNTRKLDSNCLHY